VWGSVSRLGVEKEGVITGVVAVVEEGGVSTMVREEREQGSDSKQNWKTQLICIDSGIDTNTMGHVMRAIL
jgi:hypothetical protein